MIFVCVLACRSDFPAKTFFPFLNVPFFAENVEPKNNLAGRLDGLRQLYRSRGGPQNGTVEPS